MLLLGLLVVVLVLSVRRPGAHKEKTDGVPDIKRDSGEKDT